MAEVLFSRFSSSSSSSGGPRAWGGLPHGYTDLDVEAAVFVALVGLSFRVFWGLSLSLSLSPSQL